MLQGILQARTYGYTYILIGSEPDAYEERNRSKKRMIVASIDYFIIQFSFAIKFFMRAIIVVSIRSHERCAICLHKTVAETRRGAIVLVGQRPTSSDS